MGYKKMIDERNRCYLGRDTMQKILLNDILNIKKEDWHRVRMKFNIHNGYANPIELYQENPDKVNIDWFLWRDDRRYFREGQIGICFLKVAKDTWLLTTIKEIIEELEVDPQAGGIGYRGEEKKEYKKYFGRVLVQFHNTSRTMGRTFLSVMEELEVLQILNEPFTGNDFPGYENVRLSYGQLQSIIHRKLPDWMAALQNQKAVYLLTDTNTGKVYVGSATAQTGMLLQRWSAYVQNGHGGNAELLTLVKTKGFEYVKQYFQYAILENYNARMDDKYILKREVWWKETLCSRKFGYNKN